MIVLEAGMWLAWGNLFIGWLIPAVMGIIDTARGKYDYNTEDMLGFSMMVFMAWVVATIVTYGMVG